MISIESDIESLNIFDTDAIQRLQSSFKAAKIGSTKSSCHLTRECRKHPNKNIGKLDALNLDACFWNATTSTQITTPWGSMRSMSWQTDLYPKWNIESGTQGFQHIFLRTAISLCIPRRHFSETTLWLICVDVNIRKLWKIDEEVPPNVLRFGIANLLLAPLSCQKHGPPRTHEGQARK